MCTNERLFNDAGERWSEVAVLACRQLGLPSGGAVLIAPDNNAVILLPRPDPEGCAAAGLAARGSRRYVPVGVACRVTLRPQKLRQPPPPSPPATPPPPPAIAVNYTFRRDCGSSYWSNRSRWLSGHPGAAGGAAPGQRQRPPRVGDAVLRLALQRHGPGVSQYACRSSGLPGEWSYMWPIDRDVPRASNSTPVHLVAMAGCSTDPSGALACQVAADLDDAWALYESHKNDWSALAAYWPDPSGLYNLLTHCGQRGHSLDATITCSGPDNPTEPPSPPLAIATVQNDVLTELTTYYDAVYTVRRATAARSTTSASSATRCAQITGGSKPYGVWWPSYNYRDYTPWFMDAMAWEDKDALPLTLRSIDCSAVGPSGPGPGPGGAWAWAGVSASPWGQSPLAPVPRNLSYCSVTPALSPPSSIQQECYSYFSSMAQYALTCRRADYTYHSQLMDVRLAGGSDGTWGRLEVLHSARMTEGWGTVCARRFPLAWAQAVCRDLGLGWARARLLPPSAAAPAPPSAWALDSVACQSPPWDPAGLEAVGGRPALSFLRDCNRAISTPLELCGHYTDVVVDCGGSGASVAPPSAPPTYGGYGAPPPGYGEYGGPPPPGYGGYGGYGEYGSPPPAYGA
ncbi:hypothetical protein HYH03_017511 [Edaphochlamys debaryana]|uniref:SRCR domain-containing protein n=1 Tax=Edaphochlamys debaryana TaxID=47281 RepID=A0A835XGG7_9CHLO|nr:hypothetical protein HYH03_017511 [Edaphochlamys debaryana]|eukprot:KAG2483633.1 hypothetical protein HYH03_017511 [Edaphochlamys debaryana]